MTNYISIYASQGGFDSRLFFPAMLRAQTVGTGTSPTECSYDYEYAGKHYATQFEGHDFASHDWIDFSGYATSAKILQYVDDEPQTIATVSMFLDPDNEAGIPIDSAAWMTPDALIATLQIFGGGMLSFLGNTGADKLFGSSYGDYFNGENGHDRLTGYGGNDQFLFDAIGTANFDHITDFSHAHDVIQLDHSDDGLFPGVTNGNLNKTFHDITSQAEDGNDRILYNHNTGKLFYDEDGKGGEAPIIFAVLDNHTKLDIRDFDVV